MPHIHTEPGQHDSTLSAYIIRVDDTEPKVFVHMHLKHHKLLQPGGHIELDETPWHGVIREIAEESGYRPEELQLLQPDDRQVVIPGAVVHPVPVLMNTHKISDSHYHSDVCYAFVADGPPAHSAAEGESADIRWLTLAELRAEAERGVAAKDVVVMYSVIVERYLPTYKRVSAARYSTEDPTGYSL